MKVFDVFGNESNFRGHGLVTYFGLEYPLLSYILLRFQAGFLMGKLKSAFANGDDLDALRFSYTIHIVP